MRNRTGHRHRADLAGRAHAGGADGAGRPVLTQRITTSVLALLVDMGYAPLTEVALGNGRRADVLAVDDKGGVLAVEIKSGLADFRADSKWPDYLPFCDRFFFAVDTGFPMGVLDMPDTRPETVGIIVADAYGADIVRPAPQRGMNGNRRRTVIRSMARQGALRLAAARIGTARADG
ncbi:MmcB family DNA repair protein [Eilatimonas milleporae]|uniref:MmcB family DNA repair protein n=1 Tax=Eilatimonas milleporae TaxID=911205 RepID=UPI000EF9FADA|nr:MmcB family DNA repair protein [Eilatimonas milleporae]